MPNTQRRVRPTRRGEFEIRLPREELEVLRSLPAQLREILPTEDPAVGRLFPPGYADDPEASAEYRRLVRDDLLEGHLEALRVMEATLDARRLTEDQLVSWLGAVNDLRLVLGTKLDVTEESYEREIPEDHPDAPGLALYFYLGWLEEQIVEALAEGLDPAGTEPGGGSDQAPPVDRS
jgi:uncharacterized protein DUF2017